MRQKRLKLTLGCLVVGAVFLILGAHRLNNDPESTRSLYFFFLGIMGLLMGLFVDRTLAKRMRRETRFLKRKQHEGESGKVTE